MEFRKFTLSDEEFNRLRELVFELAGISLSDAKRELVISRFSKRLRVLNLNSFSDYYNLMRSGGAAAEVQNFINSITTNKTDFFRENHHFQFLVDKFIPDVVSRNQREVRIWSAGCSTGEEPYTLAMVMRRNLVEPHGIPVKILATDIDTKVLSHGERGIYPERVVEPVPNDYLRNYFLRGKGKNEGFYKAKNTVRDMITFKQLNFIKDPFPRINLSTLYFVEM